MLFGKYHIVIFKEKSGDSRNLRFRGWFGLFAFCVFAGLCAGNVWLYSHYQEVEFLRTQLRGAEKTIEDQANHMTAMVSRITEVQEDLERVQQFDAKIRLMMNMDKEAESGAVGGSGGEEFSRSYLPLHRQELVVRKMNAFLKQLSADVRLEEVRQQELLTGVRANREVLAAMPAIWPVEGYLTSRFGGRPSPFSGRGEFHKGLDISARIGTPVQAPAKGVVVFAAVDGAYGNSVVIQHGAGISTRYAHMQRIALKEGQTVKRGDLVGTVGNTGRSSGPHLHYEVRLNGVNVDPMRYILN